MANQDINELMDIADQALKEGDEATANEVMDYIETLKTSRPAAVGGGPTTRGRYKQPEPPRVLFPAEFGMAPPTSREEQQAQLEGMGRAGKAFARGVPRALIAGPGQLMSNVVPGTNEQDFTQAYKSLEGEVFGPEDPDTGVVTKASEVLTGLPLSPTKAGAFVGKLRTTIGSAIRGGAGLGAVGAAAAYDSDAEGPKWRAVNAALGGGLGAALAVLPSLKPGIVNSIKRILNAPRDARVEADIAKLAQSPEWQEFLNTLTAGQRTGSVGIQNLEAQVAATRARQFAANQLDALNKNITRGITPGKDISDYELAHRLRGAVDKVRIANQKAASAAYGKSLDKALELARKSDTPFPVKMNETADWFSRSGKFARADIEQLLPNLPQKYRQVLEKWFTDVPGPNIAGLSEEAGFQQIRTSMEDMITLRRVGATMRSALYRLGNTPQNEALYRRGKELVDAVDADVKAFETVRENMRASGSTIPRELEDSWKNFEIANAQYRAFKDAEEATRNSAMGILFGETAGMGSPAKAFDAIMRATPAEQVRMINTANRVDPNLIRDIKQWKIQQVLGGMKDLGARSTSAGIDPQEFVKALTNGDKIVAAHMWTKPELDHIERSLAAIRLIQERAGQFNRGVDLPGTATALATRSPAFIARPVAKFFGGDALEKILFDPGSLKQLQILAATLSKPTAATAKAIGYLTALTSGATEEE